jgi:hypothetical protein
MDAINTKAFGYSENLPEIIRPIVARLCRNVATLQYKWDFYRTLFGSKENFDLLHELGLGSSSHIIEESLRFDITMAIFRLNDGDRRNLSITNLVKKCHHVSGIDALFAEFQKACKPINEHRRIMVGHEDSDTILKPRVHRIEPVYEAQINLMLTLAAVILNSILGHYGAEALDFHIVSQGGADELLYWLNEGKLRHPDKFSA